LNLGLLKAMRAMSQEKLTNKKLNKQLTMFLMAQKYFDVKILTQI
jgi:hypothetical protein